MVQVVAGRGEGIIAAGLACERRVSVSLVPAGRVGRRRASFPCSCEPGGSCRQIIFAVF